MHGEPADPVRLSLDSKPLRLVIRGPFEKAPAAAAGIAALRFPPNGRPVGLLLASLAAFGVMRRALVSKGPFEKAPAAAAGIAALRFPPNGRPVGLVLASLAAFAAFGPILCACVSKADPFG